MSMYPLSYLHQSNHYAHHTTLQITLTIMSMLAYVSHTVVDNTQMLTLIYFNLERDWNLTGSNMALVQYNEHG